MNELILLFQDIAWNHPLKPSERDAWEVLADLATDLDYFVANPIARKAAPQYFGVGTAREYVEVALKKLAGLGIDVRLEAQGKD